MAFSEEYYIKRCKKQIERKLSFTNDNGSTQRNLEILARKIEEKTGVCISLSTLKRLWKNEFKQRPQIATLNALATILDFKDWQAFKEANQDKAGRILTKKVLTYFGVSFVLIVVFVVVLLLKLWNNRIKEPVINGPVHFTAKKTVTSGIPNTIIFNYDVTNVKADSFFIQQTWNDLHRVRIDPEGNTFSRIYYESGYHRARLIANNTEIALLPIHILSNGWEPHIYYSYADLMPIDFKNEDFIEDGNLHLNKSLLEKKHVDFSKGFFTRISNSQQFDIHSDNFNLVTRIKLDSMQNSVCPWINLIVVTEKHIFMVTMHQRGCERHAYYKLGEIQRNGSDSDLSSLGCNVFEWQEIGITVKDRNAAININGKTEFTETYKEDFGKITGLIYIFERTGSIDYVKLAGTDGKVVFEDRFKSE